MKKAVTYSPKPGMADEEIMSYAPVPCLLNGLQANNVDVLPRLKVVGF
jgi:hypothetical protein